MARRMKRRAVFFLVFVLVFAAAIFLANAVFFRPSQKSAGESSSSSDAGSSSSSSDWQSGLYIVRGPSMEPLISEGSEVEIVFSREPEISSGDVVAVSIGDSESPLIKVVKAIPGDKLSLTENILVNDKVVKNSAGIPYSVDERSRHLLSLYINDYGGIIPPGSYFLLGDNILGSRDSTHFGLVDKSDIMGRVISS